MNEKRLTLRILRKKIACFMLRLMQVVNASAPYESGSLDEKVSDAFTLPIPEGVPPKKGEMRRGRLR